MSARAAALYFNKDRKTIAKMLRHELPPGYPGIPPCNQDCLAVLAWEILVNPMLEF
jgi:hypothetical protein